MNPDPKYLRRYFAARAECLDLTAAAIVAILDRLDHVEAELAGRASTPLSPVKPEDPCPPPTAS